MKSTLLFCIWLLPIIIYSQKISTDPTNPINEERPELINNFNWMERALNVYHPAGGYNDNLNSISISNPYYKREFYQGHFNLYNYDLSLPQHQEIDKLNFHPKNGWELLHKNNGLYNDEQTIIDDPLLNRVGPYFILYNKYTGVLRVLSSFNNIGVNDKIITTLQLKNASNTAPELKYSALLNNYGETSQPLDQKTEVIEIAEASNAAINGGFTSADFQMSYDPCNCGHKAEMVIDFSSLNEAELTLEGRLIATSVPLDGTGESPLLNRDDFLTSVYKDGFTVNGGMLTYKNIDALVEKYQNPIQSPFEKAGLELFKQALTGGANVLDKQMINKGSAVVMNWMFKDLPFYKEQKTVGLGILAAGAKSLNAELYPSHSVPNISFIEGEMALTGELKDEVPFNNGSINLAVPGSKNSKNVEWQYYPTYNKPLGVFALLETPTVLFESQDEDTYPGGRFDDDYRYKYFKLNSAIKYIYNPEAKVDVTNTRILAALEVRVNHTSGKGQVNNYRAYYAKNENLQPVPDAKNEGNIFITPFVPVENLQDVLAKQLESIDWDDDRTASYNGYWKSKIDVKIKFLIEYVFQKNQYGVVNRGIQVLTYPVNLISNSNVIEKYCNLNDYQQNWSSAGNLMLSQPIHHEKTAWDCITISHLIGTNPNMPASQTYKSNKIVLKPGARILPGVRLIAGLPLPSRNEQKPVSSSEVSSFCKNKYKGNEITDDLKALKSLNRKEEQILATQNKENLIDKNSHVKIYPNPTKNYINIDVKSTKASKIIVELYNFTGQKLLEDAKSSCIDYRKTLSLINYKKGIYLLKIQINNQVQTKKIVRL